MNKKYLLITFIIGLGLVLILRYFLLQKNNITRSNVSKNISVTPTAMAYFKEGDFSFSLSSNPVINGQPLKVMIKSTIPNRDIIGFDVLFGYDDKNFDFQEVQSLLPDFKLFSFKKEGFIRITAIKLPEATSPAILNNTPIISISLLPKKSGDYNLEIFDKRSLFETFFIDINQQKIYPRLKKINVTVR